jgi:hypothetical protein
MSEAIKNMPGEKVFSLVRDILTNEAARMRSFDEQSQRLGSGRDRAHEATIVGIEAAADIMTAIIAAGQEIRQRKAAPPSWVKTERDKLEWIAKEFTRVDELLRALAGQARSALANEQDAELADNERGNDQREAGDGHEAGDQA